MPNQLLGILSITYTLVETPRREVETPRRGVSTKAWKPNSLGSILNQFKSVCTKRIRLACDPDFAWQSRFYDHIIRDEKSLDRIRAYIRYNPLKWPQDSENPDCDKGRLA